jgi:hypothetical protein
MMMAGWMDFSFFFLFFGYGSVREQFQCGMGSAVGGYDKRTTSPTESEAQIPVVVVCIYGCYHQRRVIQVLRSNSTPTKYIYIYMYIYIRFTPRKQETLSPVSTDTLAVVRMSRPVGLQ